MNLATDHNRISSVAVFCGSSNGYHPMFHAAALELGRGLAGQGQRLVYGGGRIGLMGAVADGVLEAGGEVFGVIPDFLRQREGEHRAATLIEVTDTMHQRKQRMADEADAFVTFAGGLGTLDETFEILTWRQLGLHQKPIFIADIAGSSHKLLELINNVVDLGFAHPEIHGFYETFASVPDLLRRLREAR
jgi:hypothetical protein